MRCFSEAMVAPPVAVAALPPPALPYHAAARRAARPPPWPSSRSPSPRVHSRRRAPRRAVFGGVTYHRTRPDQADRLGQQIAFKASAARGPTAVLLPRGGLSALDVPGGPFWLPEADAALFESLRHWAGPQVEFLDAQY